MANFEDRMCRSAAKALMYSLESLQSIHFDTELLSNEMITTLSKLNLTEQRTLVQRAKYFLIINLDPGALQRQLTEIESLREERELEDIYLLQGAPLFLMRRLFGMHASEFTRRRGVLNIRGAGSGRPRLCSEESDHLIWKLWQHHEALQERERFLKIAEDSGLDLHIIWSALRDYI